MKAPYVIEHQAYLNDIERGLAASRAGVDPAEWCNELGLRLRVLLIVGVIVAIGALAPWSAWPM